MEEKSLEVLTFLIVAILVDKDRVVYMINWTTDLSVDSIASS